MALLICIHGIALCSQSYDSTASQLGNAGINVYAIDVRGFSSSGEANSRLDLPATLNDIANLIEQLKSHFPGTPVFILGESMGGNIALRFAELHQNMVDGIICSAPSGRLNKQRLLVLRSLALSLLTLRSPQKLFAASIINQSTTLSDLRRHIKENPEHRRNYSLPEVKQFLKFVKQSWRDRSKVSTKRLLMVQGFKDKLAVPCETAAMFRQIPVRKTLAVMTDQEHLIFEEKECPRSAAILVADFITDATSAEQGTESDGIIIGTSGRNCGKLRSIFKQAGINTDKIIESAF